MIETNPRHVLIAGVTTRAIAVSAAHAGYRVTAVDAFGDLDLRAVADVITLGPAAGTRFDPLAAAMAGERVPAGLVAYTSNLENHPKAVERLARGRRLLGNSPAVLTRVRNPIALSASLRRRRSVFEGQHENHRPDHGAGGRAELRKRRAVLAAAPRLERTHHRHSG